MSSLSRILRLLDFMRRNVVSNSNTLRVQIQNLPLPLEIRVALSSSTQNIYYLEIIITNYVCRNVVHYSRK